MSQEHVETGKRWIAHVCEQISNELKDTVVIAHWALQYNDLEYRVYFQIAEQDEDFLSFPRCTLKTCGTPSSTNDSVRSRVEATIRNRWLFLIT